MPESASERSPHEQQLDALIAEYLQASDEGRPLDQADFLRQHPEFAAELREYFVDVGKIEKVVQPIGSAQSGEVASVGLKIRDYRILEKIGAGGMGTVYLALHMRLDKTVALKILKADRECNPQAIARFEREMKAVGKLEHPHIVRAFDAGDEAGTHFLVMEYIAGCDLGRLLRTKGRLEVPLACELIRQAAIGLQHAHDHHMVHRDVKPSNLILSESGHVKLLDLGLAQLQVKQLDPGLAQLPVDAAPSDDLTSEGQFVGTWLYMAPEQFLPGRKVDARSDIFSLGVTFYSFLVGELPLNRGQAAIHLPPIGTQRADVPPDVQTLLTKMLAPHQDQRIQTMTEVAGVLQAYAAQGSVNILKNWVNRNLTDKGMSPALVDTQAGSSTVDDQEIVPPPVQATPPVKVNSSSETEGDARWRFRAALFTGIVAVIAVVLLSIVFTTASPKDISGREQAVDRIAELRVEITKALADRKQESAEAHFNELSTLSAKFNGLVETGALDELRQNIREHAGRARAEKIFAAAKKALSDEPLPVLVDRLKAYLQDPYATEITQAKSLLMDAELILAQEPGNNAMVEAWTLEELDEYLGSGKLPQEIAITNDELGNIYHARLREIAVRDYERRDMLAVQKRREDAQKAIADGLKAKADRIRADEERARKALEDKIKAEKEEWLAHPEKHGVLALIPKDAIGAIGVASVNKVLDHVGVAERDLIKDLGHIPQAAPFVQIGAGFVRSVLRYRPIECYQPDQPLALVFANPVEAKVKLEGDQLNPLFAMWDKPLLMRLGVVVGTPLDSPAVEGKLGLAAKSLAGEKIQHVVLLDEADGIMKRVSVLLIDKRLYFGFTDLAVLSVAKSLREKSLAAEMTPGEGERMASMDVLAHFAPGAWRMVWEAIAEQMKANLAAHEGDKEAIELAEDFAALMRRATTFLLGVKLDKGVEASLLVLLSPHVGARPDRFRLLLGEGEEPLTLTGLPHDGATGAFATRGNGTSNALIAKSLFLLPLGPLVLPGIEIPVDKRISLASAFQEVWNQVQGTRAAAYSGAESVAESAVVVLDTNDPAKFIERLKELVSVWDRVSVELAGGDELKAIYRFAMLEEAFEGRTAYQLSLTHRGADGVNEERLKIVRIGKQMVLPFGKDEASLSQAIKNLTEPEPRKSLAEHPGIVASDKRLPAARKMELHLCISEIVRFMPLPAGEKLVGVGPAEYSSASVTVSRDSLGLDVWVPLGEIAKSLLSPR